VKPIKISLTRVKKIRFKFQQNPQACAKVKAYNMPETQYDVDTIQDLRIQYMIVLNQVSCLLEKIKLLQTKSIGKIKYHLGKVTLQSKRNFNIKFEKLWGMTIQISQIILQEFAKDPESIGIEDVSFLLDQVEVVSDEIKAWEDNFQIIKKATTFLENSKEAYTIISNSGDRKSAKPSEILKLLNLISRARFYCSEVAERIRLMERSTLIKKNEFKIKKKLKVSNSSKEIAEVSNTKLTSISKINITTSIKSSFQNSLPFIKPKKTNQVDEKEVVCDIL